MATYQDIKGLRVKYLSADPSTLVGGDVWYNSATGTLKGVVSFEGWSSGGSLGTGRYLGSAFGTENAGVYMGGQMAPTPVGPATAINEEYNGIGWSVATSYPETIVGAGSAGTQTDGLCFGGGPPPYATTANKYNGTSWTGTGAIPTGADNWGSCGTDTTSNVIAAIGRTGSSGNAGTNTSITFNGSTWSAAPTLNTARMFGVNMGAGTGTAGLVFGGFIDPSPQAMTNTEEFNGSSWTTVNSLNRGMGLKSGLGIQTSALAVCGNTPADAGTEQYDGTSWTIKTDMPTGESYGNSSGSTGTSGFVTGIGPTRQTTVEYSRSTNVITAAAWASGPAIPTATGLGGAAGIQTAGVVFGGNRPALTAETFESDGSSWTAGGSMNLARGVTSGSGAAGSQTAALCAGGDAGAPAHAVTNSEEYNGTGWTATPAMTTARSTSGGAFGTTAAGVVFGGELAGPGFGDSNATEEYNAVSWTAGGAVPSPIRVGSAAGTLTAGLRCFGIPTTASSAEYNGTAWTVGNNAVTAREAVGGSGSTNAASIHAGGRTPAYTTATESYDGTSFVTTPSLSTANSDQYSFGTSTAAVRAGGRTPSYTAITEEFTGETSVATASTLTTS